ncbi:MAG: bifunctional nuclease family protein [Fimbriimonadaceae bacterium]|nr:bifunctional nuclease family protein [Fimbriimonadaceae bacterium]
MSDERSEEPEDLNQPPAFFSSFSETSEEGLGDDFSREPVEVKVEQVMSAQTSQTIERFVLLSDGERKLPIMIGPFEAASISQVLSEQAPTRPLCHDLIVTLLEKLDGEITHVIIDDLWSGTYYAKIVVQQGEDEFNVDSRPSDAIAIALRVNVPIYVADGILEQHGH